MALTQHVTSAIVRNVLGAATYAWSQLIRHANVNKWSRYKPVIGDWPGGSTGKYGLNLPANWDYKQPRGRALYFEPTRAADFRGYEHDQALAFPPLQCRSSELVIPQTIFPVPPEPGVDPYGASWKIRWFESLSDVRIRLADLGLSGYYFGLRISINGGTAWYKTFGQVSGADSDATFSVDCSLRDDAGFYYYNLPYGIGTYTWHVFISSTQHAGWTQIIPTNLIYFPAEVFNGITLITSGSFQVAGWVRVSDNVFSFSRTGGLNDDLSLITFLGGGVWSVQSKPDWIDVHCWDGSHQLNNPGTWVSGTYVRMSASQNYSGYRNGFVVLSAAGATVNISVEQAAALVGVSYIWSVGNQETFSISNQSHGMSVGSTNFDLAFDHTFAGDAYKPWSITKQGYGLLANGSGNPGGIRLRTGIPGYRAGVLSQAIQDGDIIYIMIGLNTEE